MKNRFDMKLLNLKHIALVALFPLLFSCVEKVNPEPSPNDQPGKETPDPPVVSKPSAEIQQADLFAQHMLGTYYLWTKEINDDIAKLNPDTCTTPIPIVKQIRYHQNRKEVDHWTELTEDLSSFTSSVQGLGLSFGYELQVGRISNKEGAYFMLVCYVNKGKPADKAGLKRGDIIMSIDGSDITSSNLYDAFYAENVTLGIAHLTSEGYLGPVEKTVSMTADKEWEDPVIVNKTFDVGGKKVGYLAYGAFDLKSSETLPDVFREFKKEGIEELILDLRYNGGGYAFTECELASMIAPSSVVSAGEVFQTEVYNAILSEEWKRQNYDTNTYFATRHIMESQGIDVDVSDANPGIKKLYAIVTGGSASASEGLIVGLSPYMDVTLIGSQTYGKYCAGWMMSPEDLYGTNSQYDYSKITKWGMYVMVSKFADKNGDNAAQPDGIPVQIESEDNPFDGYELGDENETMLKAALAAAGKTATKSSIEIRKPFETNFVDYGVPRGILIKTDVPQVVNNF
ncbi:MAG: PDZ domain-containing protein [Bacteroidales bacterium]|nr:PDZ domain-containing protein [Bacteroidales bacterium]